jgi:diaminopimelate decarboxylase
MPHQIAEEKIAQLTQKWLRSPLSAEHPACQFYLTESLTERLHQVTNAFPANSLHTVAIKANPLLAVLRHVRKRGFAVEAASMGEIQLALEAGFAEEQIIFDSPVKTEAELRFALHNGMPVNVDNYHELARIAAIRKNTCQSAIGLRVNPQVGAGSIPTTSVAASYSKFGIPIKEQNEHLLQAFRQYPWLCGVHLHIGSQGCSINQLLQGIDTVLHFLSQWRGTFPELPNQLRFLDIGGGLPVSYQFNETPPNMQEYATQVVQLLEKHQWQHLQLITEFGRYYHVNSGFSISKVEYVKAYTQPQTAMIHLGADYFVRECLNPESWYHEVSVLDNQGVRKLPTPSATYNLAGPLCFAGDIVVRNRELPKMHPEDYVVIHDTGGYTFAMYSRYISRQMPPIVDVDSNGELSLLRPGETAAQTVLFWEGKW